MPYLIFQRKTGTGNQGTGTGILGGGVSVTGSTLTSATKRWDMATNAVTSSTALSGPILQPGAISDGTQAHFAFGNQDLNYNASSGTEYMDKYVYSSEARTQPVANLNGSVRMSVACFGNPTYGWFASGVNSGVAYLTDNLRVQHSTSGQTNSATLGTSSGDGAAGLSSSTSGYIFGGFTGSALNVIRKYGMPAGTWSNLGATISVSRYIFRGDGNGTFGVIGGGWTGSVNSAVVDKFTFGTETITSAPSLSTAKHGVNAMGNKIIVVFAGTNPTVGTSDRFYFASETMTTTTSLSPAQHRGAATCNQNGGLL